MLEGRGVYSNGKELTAPEGIVIIIIYLSESVAVQTKHVVIPAFAGMTNGASKTVTVLCQKG